MIYWWVDDEIMVGIGIPGPIIIEIGLNHVG